MSDADVQHALVNATTCALERHPTGDRWRTDGPDIDGDTLTLIVVVEDGLAVVTVY